MHQIEKMVDYFQYVILQKIKNWILPIAMVLGGVFHDFFASLSGVIPYVIFMLLLAPYSKLSLQGIRVTKLHWTLLSIQLSATVAIYCLLALYDPIIAQGVFICVLAPTATSAAVITGMLGGSVAGIATFCLLSNCAVAIVAPLIFSMIGTPVELPFWVSVFAVCRKMFPILILPFVVTLLLKGFAPKVHEILRKSQKTSFYLWAFALTVVMGKTVCFLLQEDTTHWGTQIIIALLALGVCLGQFMVGRHIGKRYAARLTAGQALGQKNTVLAIWMAQSYLNPIASVGPASYVIWQNIVNSWQLYQKRRQEEGSAGQ